MTKYALLLTCLLTAPVFAGNAYVGVGVGGSSIEASYDDLDDNSSAYTGFVGYNVTPALAVEIGYHDLGDFSTDYTETDIDAFSLSALGSFSIGGDTRLYGRLGVALASTDTTFTCDDDYKKKSWCEDYSDSDNATDILIGAGVSFQASPHFGVRAEVAQFDLEDTDGALVYGVAGTYTF
jgi:opacity protein-like surface antigen